VAIATAVLSVAVAGLFWTGPAIYPHFTSHPNSKPSTSPTDTASGTAAPGSVLTPPAASQFDPYGDHTDPHVREAPKAIDGNPATAWHTQTFGTADLGHLKPGVGLLVDLGSSQRVSGVRLHLLGRGTTVALLESGSPPASDKAMTNVATATDADSDVTLRPPASTSARYWVVWLTRLPAGANGFQGGIAELTFTS
jgi:eukaryotic-like serine/threonine-protein kinase